MNRIAFFDAKEYDIDSFNSNKPEDYEIAYFETHLTEDTVALASGYDTVCVFVNDVINDKVIDALIDEGVKLIALRCAGYNNVNIDYAKGKIAIVRVPAYSPYAVAEHAMALLLTSIRRIHKAYIRTRDFNFSLKGLTGFDLHGKTVGVIGTGRIGKVFIDICRGFGMKVVAYDKYPDTKSDIDYVSLNRLFEMSDIISLHCPLTEETKHLINSSSIGLMKRGVVIVNTSRGALIDSESLLEGIKCRIIGAACLDVYEEESDLFYNDFSEHIIDDDTLARLISMPNVIVSSHQAFLTKEALYNIAETTYSNIKEYFACGFAENELPHR